MPRDRERAFELMLQVSPERIRHCRIWCGIVVRRWAGGTHARFGKVETSGYNGPRTRGLRRHGIKLKSLEIGIDQLTVPVEHATVMRAAKRSNVRAGPGTSYAKVSLLEVGQAVRAIERIGAWFKLQPKPGQPERFVYAPLLSETAPTAGIE